MALADTPKDALMAQQPVGEQSSWRWSLYLLVGGGQQGKQQVSERHRVDEPLNPLDRGALGHDAEIGWGSVAGPALWVKQRLTGFVLPQQLQSWGY